MTDEKSNFLNNFSQEVKLTKVFQSFNSEYLNNYLISVKDEQNQKDFWMIDGQLREDGQKKVREVQSDEEEQNINTGNKNGSLKSNPNQNVSEFLPQYLNCLYHKNFNNLEEAIKFNQELQSDTKVLKQVMDRITRNDKFQKCQQFVQEIKIHFIQPTKHYEIVAVWLQCGWYKTKILILNNSSAQIKKSPLHYSTSVNGFGSFGNLYFIKSQNQSYAVKCICSMRSVKDQFQFEVRAKLLVGAFQEYFFLKLFSELEIGPKVKNCFGFDMVVFEDCIQFSMEICTRIDSNPKVEQKLIESLKTMSLLQIIHRDIKTDNIMWSEQFKKPVFIDFGETRFIKESVGIKKATSFVGTMGFVSVEMGKVFTDQKGIVDLYYNDLFGLKESLKFFDKFERQLFGIENMFHIYQVQSSQFLLFLIKHKLLTKHYSEFSHLWQLMRKFYLNVHQTIEQSIEYKLLQFMLDLRPNKSLMEIYWRISDEVREIKQFEDLRDVYTQKQSFHLAIWTKFHFKQEKFKNEISLYQLIGKDYQNNSSVQRKILTILQSKQNVDQYLGQIQQNYGNQFIKEENVIVYCVVLSYYCMIGNGKFDIEIEKKVQVASQAMKILKQIKPYGNQSSKTKTQFNFMSLFFVCRLQELKPIGLFFQQFMFKLWPSIPEHFKDECLRITVSSLSLLGYPFYLKQAKDLFMYFVFKKESNEELGRIDGVRQKLVNILFFWKVTALIRVYGEVFYNRSKSNFLFPSQKIQCITIQVDDYMSHLMTPLTDIKFTILNHNFYQNVEKFRTIIFSKQFILQIMRQLENENYLNIPQINWIQYYRQWKQHILFIFNVMPGHGFLPLEIKIMLKTKPSIICLGEDLNLTIHFSTFLNFCKVTWNLERLGKMIKFIDQTINYQPISERFLLNFRLFFAWKMKNILTLKTLSNIIYEETFQFSVQNLSYLSQTVMIVHKIFLLQQKSIWNFIIEKLVSFDHLFKVVKKIQYHIRHFTQKENLNFPIQNLTLTFKSQPSLLQKNINQSTLPQIQERFNLVDEVEVVSFQLTSQEQVLFRIFYHIIRTLCLLSEILRFSLVFNNLGLTKTFIELMPTFENIDIVTHLRAILPQKLKKSLILSSQTQKQLRDFIIFSINLLSSPSIPLSKFYNAQWNIDNKVLLQVLLEGSYANQQIPQIFKRDSWNKINESKQLFYQNSTSNNPSQRIAAIYSLSKIVNYKSTNIQDYAALLSYYKMRKNQKTLLKMMFEKNMVKCSFVAFIYCERPYSQFLQFLLNVTELLNAINEKFVIEAFCESIRNKFYCLCQHCFPIPPKNWKPLEFIEYIYSQMYSFNDTSHPYMIIVLMAAILNKYFSFKIRRKFFGFIHKALEHLTPIARNYICEQIYSEAFIIKAIEKEIYFPGQYSTDYKQIKPQIQIKFDKRIIKMQFYYASKHYKSHSQYIGFKINQLVDQRFVLKKKRNPKWKIPLFIEKLYRKKLHKYHFIFDGFREKVSNIQLNIDLLKQFQ